MSEPNEITREWLESVGFRLSKKPDKRKAEQYSEYILVLPSHLFVKVVWWHYKNVSRDSIVVSTATYGGGPLRLPAHVLSSRSNFSNFIKCLSGVDLASEPCNSTSQPPSTKTLPTSPPV